MFPPPITLRSCCRRRHASLRYAMRADISPPLIFSPLYDDFFRAMLHAAAADAIISIMLFRC